MKMMQGACALPCSKRSRTREAPTPTNISTKSEPDIEKKGRPASPATALASSVLPVPGGPTSSAPFGSRPPRRWNFCGSFRKSMISSSSCFASSQPATSANVTFGLSPASSLAFDFPNAKARLPPCCICRSMKITSPKISRYGRNVSSTTPNDWPDSRARTSTPLVLSASTHLSSASNGSKTLKRSTVCRFNVLLPFEADDKWVEALSTKGVDVRARESGQSFGVVLLTFLPYLLIFGLVIFMLRQMQQGGNRAFAFGKSKAKLLAGDTPKVTFADVAGCDEAKQELEEIIDFLKDPQKFQRLGGRLPKGALLVGPPGTGKTLLAKAVAGEAGRPFLSMSGSDFVEMFVGVGASRVRDLFEQGKAHAPCIIFIDEIDAVGRHRGAGLGGGHDEREQTLNQLLVEMDGFESNDGVILLAATNRPDILDPALLRPGRFDRQIVVDMPDVKGREQILRVHTRKIPLSTGVNLERIAKGTPGLAGAELANVVNEAALLAARRNQPHVDNADFEDAKDKVMLGLERRSRVLSDEERRLIA